MANESAAEPTQSQSIPSQPAPVPTGKSGQLSHAAQVATSVYRKPSKPQKAK